MHVGRLQHSEHGGGAGGDGNAVAKGRAGAQDQRQQGQAIRGAHGNPSGKVMLDSMIRSAPSSIKVGTNCYADASNKYPGRAAGPGDA